MKGNSVGMRINQWNGEYNKTKNDNVPWVKEHESLNFLPLKSK